MHDGVLALCGVHNRRVDAVITDYSLPDITALDLLSPFECSDQKDQILYEIGQVACGNSLKTALRSFYTPRTTYAFNEDVCLMANHVC